MLTDAEIRRLRPKERPYKRADGGGLYLLVTETAKLWRLKYRFHGKERLLAIGAYPDVSLKAARDERDAARSDLAAGKDPGIERSRRGRASKAADTFEALALEWHANQAPAWTERHAKDVLDSLQDDVFPEIGAVRIGQIEAPEVLALLRKIERRPALETARRVRQRISAVFVYAIATGKGRADPAAVVKEAMAPMVKGRQPAVTDLGEARDMLRKAEAIPAHPATRLALRFLALTAVRPGEVRAMTWGEIDGDLWKIPAERMKMRREHWVPLSGWARDALDAAAALQRGRNDARLVFPNARSVLRPISENAIGYLLNRAGYHHKHVPHGWRATFSTVMNERFRGDRYVIDLMLAHVSGDKVEAAYNRALYLDRRRELAQIWADLLLDGFDPAASLLEGPKR